MSILDGTIFEGATRVFLDSTDTSLSGTFQVSDGVGGHEDLQVSDGSTGSEDYIVWNSFIDLSPGTISQFDSVEDHIEKYESLNASLSSTGFRPSGSGPITALLELNDVVYAARTLADQSGAQIYRTTDLFDLTQEVEWEPIDMGYEVSFDNGRTKPISIVEREFLDTEVVASPPIEDRRPSTAESVATVNSGGFSLGEWKDLSNLFTADTTAVANAESNSNTGPRYSQMAQLRGFTTSSDANPNAKITGFSATISYQIDVVAPSTATTYGLLSNVRLLNVDGTDNKGSMTQIAMTQDDIFYTTGLITTTFGGASDTWNAGNLDTSAVLNPDFGIEIELGAGISQITSGVRNARKFYIADVKITVHFEDGTERVYFWDGASDVAEADMLEAQRLEGDWGSGNASGWMTFYNVTNPESIVDNLEIRSASGGSGSFLANTASDLKQNLLPTWQEMADNSSIAQHIKANFFIDSAKKAIYGVTGAGPAFTYDGQYFRFIHTPVPLEKDKPRHVIEHESHLVLAFQSGSILLSVVGQPDNFAGIDGASEFGFGDTITDLVPLSGSALAVLCQESAHALVGNTIDNFTTQVISKTSGAIEYSATTVGQPIYADFRGISSIANTNQFGDFLAGRLSQRVTKLIQGRIQDFSGVSLDLQDLVCAIPVRNRNQYKLFFNDGFIITMTLFGIADENPVFTVQKYGAKKDTLLNPDTTYVPTAILSTVLSRGAELNMIGTKDGDIYVLNQGTGILTGRGIEDYYATITFNPFNGGEPHANLKYNEIIIHGQTSGGQELVTSSGVNYLIPDPNTQTDEITMGQIDEGFNLQLIPQLKSTHLPNVTSGFSLKIESQADGNLPHILQALTFRPVLTGDQSIGQKTYTGQI